MAEGLRDGRQKENGRRLRDSHGFAMWCQAREGSGESQAEEQHGRGKEEAARRGARVLQFCLAHGVTRTLVGLHGECAKTELWLVELSKVGGECPISGQWLAASSQEAGDKCWAVVSSG